VQTNICNGEGEKSHPSHERDLTRKHLCTTGQASDLGGQAKAHRVEKPTDAVVKIARTRSAY